MIDFDPPLSGVVAARSAEVLSRVSEPVFADRVLDVTTFGAVGDGVSDAAPAIAAAVSACSAAGGGRVLVPAGRFRTGAVHLLDDVELHLASGAVLAFSQDPDDFLPPVRTRYEGVDCFNYSPLIYAIGRRNIAVTGDGVIDGGADSQHWWNWVKAPAPEEGPAKQRLLAAAAARVAVSDRVFGAGDNLRPNLLQFVDCRNVLISGVTFRRSPMWTIHPLRCTNVTIRGVLVDSRGPNNDGCNPESSRDVLIEDCTFDTGDDCIAIKAGKGPDGWHPGEATAGVVIRDCRMRAGHGGITVGSETSGGVSDVVAYRCRMSSPELGRALRIKSNPERGGYIRDILFADIEVGEVRQAVLEVALDYGRVTAGPHPPDVRGIEVLRVSAESAGCAVRLIGLPDAPIRRLRLRDCSFGRLAGPDVVRHVVDSDLGPGRGEPEQLPQR
ncbi:glycoside hydrolase family 28 protein [Occultella glacieicola]|uniref:Glycoside hydrolase family 28 protein n=1 Tax=Occultella glacieicola TaxID=2518684 RepID=A0ABY2DXB6_9MICO|nr:glycoside hydrolase family 28 protein [Occultella glacieicola]TDE88520.1 glycoside hydrolase family 28 protein [Occultella glacieicola]